MQSCEYNYLIHKSTPVNERNPIITSLFFYITIPFKFIPRLHIANIPCCDYPKYEYCKIDQ